MRIRVTTRADLYEKRKQEHIERGYRIEDEQPIPVNGLCSFVAIEESGNQETLAKCVAQALKRSYGFRKNSEIPMSLKIRFRFDGRCPRHPLYDPTRDGHSSAGKCEGCEAQYVIHLYPKVAKRRAADANLIVIRTRTDREQQKTGVRPSSEPGD